MRGKADADAGRPDRLELLQVLGRRLLPKPLEPASPVRGEEQDDLDPGLGGSLDRGVRLGQAQVVELPDGRVAGGEHLPVHVHVARADLFGGQFPGHVQHGLAPAPEVLALRAAAQGALEGVAVRVDEPRQAEGLRHRRILSACDGSQMR